MNPSLTEYLDYLRAETQPTPHLGNQFKEDSILQHYLSFFLPIEYKQKAFEIFNDIGEKCCNEYLINAKDAENNPPKLVQFASNGERLDEIQTTIGWKNHKIFAARDGIVALAYENKFKEYSRFIQAIALYMYQVSSGMFGCPLAMTDGAAALLKNLNLKDPKAKVKVNDAFKHLTSRDPSLFWTSGQWMTEKRGGSDVSNSTETIAVSYKNNKFKLYGYKWFSSATECDMSLVLARIVDLELFEKINDFGEKYEYLRKIPVSLFMIKTRKKVKDSNGFINEEEQKTRLNNIEIIRMKDKMGTRQLPTAELLLKGTKAILLSDSGKGIKTISTMLNITRYYNSACAVSNIRRFVALLRDFSDRRQVFGRKLNENPLHLKNLANMEVTLRGNLIFYLKTSQMLSFVESNQNKSSLTNEEMLLRLFVPILKLFTAKECIKVGSEGIEGFGAMGYIEGSGIPTLMRDLQVLSIWEGTTNVLCYDVYRVLKSLKLPLLSAYSDFFSSIIRASVISEGKLDENQIIRTKIKELTEAYHAIMSEMREIAENNNRSKWDTEHNLRNLSFSIARLTISTLLFEVWIRSGRSTDKETFIRWIAQEPLYKKREITERKEIRGKRDLMEARIVEEEEKKNKEEIRKLALDIDEMGRMRGVGERDREGKLRPKF